MLCIQMEATFEKMDKKELKVDMIRDLQDKYRTRLSSSAKVSFKFDDWNIRFYF